jgi:hypothetical protein
MKVARIVGYRASVVTFLATIAYIIVQIMQIVGMITFPFDGILIYSTSLLISIPFLLSMLSLHYCTPEKNKLWSHAALLSAVIYVIFVVANYVVQLATVIPAKLAGEVEAIRILDQKPHSLFWDYDAVGYIFMGISTLFAVPAVKYQGAGKWLKIAFIANACATPFISFVYFYRNFSEKLLLIGLVWAIIAPFFMYRLALFFRNMKFRTTDLSERRS